jgi:hypothetical protein
VPYSTEMGRGAYHIAKHNLGVMIEDQLGTFPHMSIARLINFEKFISKIKIIFEDSIFSLHWGIFSILKKKLFRKISTFLKIN